MAALQRAELIARAFAGNDDLRKRVHAAIGMRLAYSYLPSSSFFTDKTNRADRPESGAIATILRHLQLYPEQQ